MADRSSEQPSLSELREAYEFLKNLPLDQVASIATRDLGSELLGQDLYAGNPLDRLTSWARTTIPALLRRQKEEAVKVSQALRKASNEPDVDRLAILIAFLVHQVPALRDLPIVELTAFALVILRKYDYRSGS